MRDEVLITQKMLKNRQPDGTYRVAKIGFVHIDDNLLHAAQEMGGAVAFWCVEASSTADPTNHYHATSIVPDEEEAMEPNAEASEKQPTHKNEVFVIHGRNAAIRLSVERFLRSVGITPIEWSKAIALTNTPNPYTWQIVDTALTEAAAIIVLFTPDDEAKLRDEFIKPNDEYYESELTPQPRANVLFEAGVAFGRNVQRTLMVSLGKIRPISDLAGHHILRLNNSAESRLDFINRLKSAGCEVDLRGTAWLKEGDFELPEPKQEVTEVTPSVVPKSRIPRPSDVSVGRIIEEDEHFPEIQREIDLNLLRQQLAVTELSIEDQSTVKALQAWLIKRVSKEDQVVRFSVVDGQTALVPGTAARLLELTAYNLSMNPKPVGDYAIVVSPPSVVGTGDKPLPCP